ncbi:PEGA domain-containing protein [Sorangium sp. So ce1151]|uniref:PEGA domain-containing protein n=1 Tax=Sorangium sp. So ce1151 TaxID=3133332 RepID=UPI003F5D57A9
MAMVLLTGSATEAQAPPSKAPSSAAKLAPGAAQPDGSDAKAEAERHYVKGRGHFDEGDFREAYDEYRTSVALHKTPKAMAAAASSLRELGRYDEAMNQYEQVKRDFRDLEPAIKVKVDKGLEELATLVGTLEVTGDMPAGARLFVDDRERGKLPLSEPLRVAVGTWKLRAEKEGFEPITATAEVKSGQKSVAELRASSRKGRLSVREKHGWVLEVEVDGQRLGVTPWEGLVDPGEHQVRLRGFVGLDALAECTAPEPGASGTAEAAREGVKMASLVQTATVKLYEVTPVVVSAEDVDASLRVESTPGGAHVIIDGRGVGRTPWEGRLPLGEHAIEVRAAGFLLAKQAVRLERRKQREVQVVLEREPDPEGERRTRNIAATVGYGVGAAGLGLLAVTGGLALKEVGEVRSRCGGTSCPQSEREKLDEAGDLGTLATVGLVVGAVGVAGGTAALFVLQPSGGDRRPGAPGGGAKPAGGVAWRAGVGLGRFEIEGRF